MVQKLRQFYWRSGFGLLVELQRGSVCPAACAAGLFMTWKARRSFFFYSAFWSHFEFLEPYTTTQFLWKNTTKKLILWLLWPKGGGGVSQKCHECHGEENLVVWKLQYLIFHQFNIKYFLQHSAILMSRSSHICASMSHILTGTEMCADESWHDFEFLDCIRLH